jgi:hypothetical protein
MFRDENKKTAGHREMLMGLVAAMGTTVLSGIQTLWDNDVDGDGEEIKKSQQR